ncbi:MAG: hypothetical protein ACXWP4_04130 [Polyangiales bacterium]
MSSLHALILGVFSIAAVGCAAKPAAPIEVAAPTSPRSFRCAKSMIYALTPTGSLVSSDGARWTPLDLSSAPARSVWGTSCDDVFVLYEDGSLFHGDGVSFSPVSPT